MKKLHLSFAFFLSVGICQLFSQNMYIHAGFGYAFASGTQQIGQEVVYNPQEFGYSLKSINGSYGAGINFSGSVGKMFTPVLGMDIAINYLIGRNYTSTTTEITPTSTIIEKTDTRSNGFSITPSLLLMTNGLKFKPYAKIGVSVGSYFIKEKFDGTAYQNGQPIQYHSESERKTTGELSIGIRGGVGILYPLNSNLTIFSEFIYTGMSYKKKKSEITSYTINGDDRLDRLTEKGRVTVYVKEIVSKPFDSQQPDEELQTPSPLSSISINIGVHFVINKSKEIN